MNDFYKKPGKKIALQSSSEFIPGQNKRLQNQEK